MNRVRQDSSKVDFDFTSNTTNYLGALQPIFGNRSSVFACPSTRPPTNDVTSYLGNAVVLGRKMPNVRRASALVYLQEFDQCTSTAHLRPRLVGTVKYGTWAFQTDGKQNYTSIHDNGGNLLFMDSHVEYRKGKNLRSGDFGLSPPDKTQDDPNQQYDADL